MYARRRASRATRAAATAYSIALLGLVASTNVTAATCSCAGVPLLGAMQSSAHSSRYYFGTGFEYRDLSDLVAGSRDVPDQTGRDRGSQAMVIEGAATLSEHWSVAGITTWMEHERRVGTGSTKRGRGLGDGVVMLRWSPLRTGLTQPWAISTGIGARVPLGDNNRKSGALTLAEDLQPSTGAWGTVLQISGSRALTRSGTWTAWGSAGAAYNGENDRDYQFGDNLTLSVGAIWRGLPRWGLGLEFHHRRADRDSRNGTAIPNTGGRWLNLQASAQFQFNERLGARISLLRPLRRDLNDALQFTTAHGVSVGLAYAF